MISLNNQGIRKTADEYYKNEIANDLKNSIDNSDMVLISKLGDLKNALSGDKVNLRTVKQQINSITAFDKSQNYSYLNNMLHPEKARGCKIPSQVPVPSCSFQLHNCVTVSTNASGNCAFILNPFFLASEEIIGFDLSTMGGPAYFVHKFLTSLWVNNDATLTGQATNDQWKPVDIGQVLPAVYDQYRLVSASVVVKYIGRLDIASGVLGGAIIYDESNTLGGQLQAKSGTNPYNPAAAGIDSKTNDLTKFGNFDLAMDSFYHQENLCIEGARMLYFPLDNSFEEYVKVCDSSVIGCTYSGSNIFFDMPQDYYKAGFNWFFYSLGAPPNANCFKVDIYCNFECLPNAKYLNYMPITLNPYVISNEEKKRMNLVVQNKPVLKANEDPDDGVQVPSLFNKMIKKFDNGLPGFEKLRAYGIMTGVPGLKSGLALAGTMIGQNTMDFD